MGSKFTDICKEGEVKIIGRKLKGIKTKWLVLRKESSKGLKRLDKYSSKSEMINFPVAKKCVPLNNVMQVNVLQTENGFIITIIFTDDTIYEFLCKAEAEAFHWKNSILDLIHDDKLMNNKTTNVCAYILPSIIEFFGECIISIKDRKIIVKDRESFKIIIEWSIEHLRNFTYNNDKFVIEAGRRSSTGESLFIFNTPHSKKLENAIDFETAMINQ